MKPGAQPRIGILAQPSLIPILERCTRAAAGGLGVVTGDRPAALLDRFGPHLRLILVESSIAPQVLSRRGAAPQARFVMVTPDIQDAMLADALRVPSLLGFLVWGPDGFYGWEVAYIVRRALGQGGRPPMSAQLMSWGATTVSWKPRTTADRDRVMTSVEGACRRLGVGSRMAALTGHAAYELMVNAMSGAPRSGRYSDPGGPVRLSEEHAPRLTLAVDDNFVGLDAVDPFGRLEASELFGSLLENRNRLDGNRPGVTLARLYRTATLLRAEVTPGRRTHVGWMADRGVDEPVEQAGSVYFVPEVRQAATLYRILQWANDAGSVKAVSRIRMRTLPYATLEGVDLAQAGPQTEASLDLLDRVRTAASAVVGKTCPY